MANLSVQRIAELFSIIATSYSRYWVQVSQAWQTIHVANKTVSTARFHAIRDLTRDGTDNAAYSLDLLVVLMRDVSTSGETSA